MTWSLDDDDWCWLRPRGNLPLAPLPEEPPLDDCCHRTDFNAPDVPADHPMQHLARARRGGGRAAHAVRSDERITFPLRDRPGLVYAGSDDQRYARQQVISAIYAVAAAWDDLRKKELASQANDPSAVPRPLLQIIALGNIGGGPLHKNHPPPNADPFHKSHDLGVDVDVSVVRRDGKTGRSTYKDKDAATYSHELTREAIGLFLAQGILKVVRVFYDDPQIGLPPNIVSPDRKSEHDNHFHARFTPPPGEYP